MVLYSNANDTTNAWAINQEGKDRSVTYSMALEVG